MGEPLRVDELRNALQSTSEQEHDAIIAELVDEGILDEDGNVLKRFPQLPEWLGGRNGHAGKIRGKSNLPKTVKRPRGKI